MGSVEGHLQSSPDLCNRSALSDSLNSPMFRRWVPNPCHCIRTILDYLGVWAEPGYDVNAKVVGVGGSHSP